MNVLIFNGSPRMGGDTDALIEAFLRGLGSEARMVRASQAGIAPCCDCRRCWTQPGCALPDDGMEEIRARVREADGVVIASPVFLSQLTGPLLSLLSRMQCDYAARRFLGAAAEERRPLGGVLLAAGGAGAAEPALAGARTALSMMRAQVLGCACALHTDKTPARRDGEALHAAAALGRRMAERLGEIDGRREIV